jgi:hypothetical protein
MYLAQDRDQWWALVNTTINLLGVDFKEVGCEGGVNSTILQQGVMMGSCDQGNKLLEFIEYCKFLE